MGDRRRETFRMVRRASRPLAKFLESSGVFVLVRRALRDKRHRRAFLRSPESYLRARGLAIPDGIRIGVTVPRTRTRPVVPPDCPRGLVPVLRERKVTVCSGTLYYIWVVTKLPGGGWIRTLTPFCDGLTRSEITYEWSCELATLP